MISIVGFLVYSLSNVSFVWLISYIVDSLQSGAAPMATEVKQYLSTILGEEGDLNRTLIPVLIVLIATTRGLGAFVGNYFIAYVSNNLVHNLRQELFDRLLTLPSAFYDRHAMGHLVAKVTYHVAQVTGAATDAVRVIIREGFTVLGYMGYLLFLSWKLTLVFIAVGPVIAVLVGFAGKRFRRISQRIQNSMGDVTHVASEAVQGYREVRTFGGSDYESERFNKVRSGQSPAIDENGGDIVTRNACHSDHGFFCAGRSCLAGAGPCLPVEHVYGCCHCVYHYWRFAGKANTPIVRGRRYRAEGPGSSRRYF